MSRRARKEHVCVWIHTDCMFFGSRNKERVCSFQVRALLFFPLGRYEKPRGKENEDLSIHTSTQERRDFEIWIISGSRRVTRAVSDRQMERHSQPHSHTKGPFTHTKEPQRPRTELFNELRARGAVRLPDPTDKKLKGGGWKSGGDSNARCCWPWFGYWLKLPMYSMLTLQAETARSNMGSGVIIQKHIMVNICFTVMKP